MQRQMMGCIVTWRTARRLRLFIYLFGVGGSVFILVAGDGKSATLSRRSSFVNCDQPAHGRALERLCVACCARGQPQPASLHPSYSYSPTYQTMSSANFSCSIGCSDAENTVTHASRVTFLLPGQESKSSDRVRSALIGVGLEFALLGYLHGFRSAAAPTPRSSTWIFRWKVERNGLQDSFPSFFFNFLYISIKSLPDDLQLGARQACQFDALYHFFFLLFISTCALRLCSPLTFGVLRARVRQFCYSGIFFLKKENTIQ